MIGLTLLSLMLCAACSSRPRVVTVHRVERVTPPVHLMDVTPVPDCSDARTNEDLLDCVLDTREALDRANADKAAIKQSVGE